MPSQAPQWTEYLSCPICIKVFNEKDHKPISLGCGHTVCRICLVNLQEKKCPYDSCVITKKIDELPVNYALLQLVGAAIPEDERTEANLVKENSSFYESCKKCIEELAANMKSLTDDESENEDEMLKHLQSNSSHQSSSNSILSRPMQRKLVTLINCQLVEEEGRARAMRAARSLGERTVAELILQHQNPQQLSANLWAAVRARGCQFLGPEMQAEVLKLILLALEDGSALARKVLVLFVVQRLEATFTQASKTAIGHVVQLLYRASCFKVTKRDDTSSLMQLKDEFRTYEALRREHDSQIVQIAMEAGLRISPEQWSSLLYGDPAHKSHMQSIIDKLQTPQSFAQSVNELIIVLQRTSDPGKLHLLQPHFEFLAKIDPSQDKQVPSWENLEAILRALRTVVQSLINYLNNHSHKKSDLLPAQNVRYKTSMCRDFSMNKSCPRSVNCTFAHSEEELERFRSKKKFGTKCYTAVPLASTSLNAKEKEELELVNRSTDCKLDSRNATGTSVLTILTNSSKTNTSIAKSVPMTNVVKPMMAPPATSIVSLTTDTTTSIATSSSITSVSSSNKLLPGAMVQGIPSVSSFPLQSEVSSVYYPPAIPIPPVHHSLMPNAPLSSSAVHHTPMATATPHHLHQTYVRPTGAAARYPTAIQTYPSVLPYQVEAAGACAHNVHGYMCDGQSHGIAQMHGLPQQIGMTHYPCADGSYRMMNPAYRNATTPPPSVGVTPLAVQPTLQPSKNTDQQFSNQNVGNCIVYSYLPTCYKMLEPLNTMPASNGTASSYISDTNYVQNSPPTSNYIVQTDVESPHIQVVQVDGVSHFVPIDTNKPRILTHNSCQDTVKSTIETFSSCQISDDRRMDGISTRLELQ